MKPKNSNSGSEPCTNPGKKHDRTMDDLISRQAAIDTLKDVSEHYTDKGREWHPHVDFMVEAIQDLPSAQPEKRTEKRTETHACD